MIHYSSYNISEAECVAGLLLRSPKTRVRVEKDYDIRVFIVFSQWLESCADSAASRSLLGTHTHVSLLVLRIALTDIWTVILQARAKMSTCAPGRSQRTKSLTTTVIVSPSIEKSNGPRKISTTWMKKRKTDLSRRSRRCSPPTSTSLHHLRDVIVLHGYSPVRSFICLKSYITDLWDFNRILYSHSQLGL